MLALAACSENEITEQNPAVNKAIGFDMYTGVQTRGTEIDLPAVKTSGIGVMAYQTSGDFQTTGGKSEFMKNQQVTWNSGTNKWEYSPVKYWPAGTDEKVSFFAYAPYASTDGAHGITPTSPAASDNPRIGFELQTNQKDMVDLVVSDPAAASNVTTDMTTGTVTFKFTHPLTRVAMEAKTGTDISANTDTKVFVTGVSLVHSKKLGSKGTLDMKALSWTFNTTTTDYLASPYALAAASSNGILNLTAANFAGYTTASIDIAAGGATATSLFPANEYLFLLPVGNTTGTAAAGDVKVKIAYDIVNKINDTTHSKSSVEKTVDLPAGVLKKGAAHKFTFIIGLNAITFDVDTDASWGAETNNDVTVQ